MLFSLSIYGERHKALWLEWEEETNTHKVGIEIFYEDLGEESQVEQPIQGFYTNSTAKEIVVNDGWQYKPNDYIETETGRWMITRVEVIPEEEETGLRSFDFNPSYFSRRRITLS